MQGLAFSISSKYGPMADAFRLTGWTMALWCAVNRFLLMTILRAQLVNARCVKIPPNSVYILEERDVELLTSEMRDKH